jgi:hypothetical protein
MTVSQNLLHPRKLGHKKEIFWIEDSLDAINHFNCLFQNRFHCKRCKILLDFFSQDPKKKAVIICDQKMKALTKRKKIGQPELLSVIAKNLKDLKQ